eukprot:jgi/Hompol1/6787/HPOL_002328-RA
MESAVARSVSAVLSAASLAFDYELLLKLRNAERIDIAHLLDRLTETDDEAIIARALRIHCKESLQVSPDGTAVRLADPSIIADNSPAMLDLDSRCIYVERLPASKSQNPVEMIKALFVQYGAIDRVILPHTRSRKYAKRTLEYFDLIQSKHAHLEQAKSRLIGHMDHATFVSGVIAAFEGVHEASDRTTIKRLFEMVAPVSFVDHNRHETKLAKRTLKAELDAPLHSKSSSVSANRSHITFDNDVDDNQRVATIAPLLQDQPAASKHITFNYSDDETVSTTQTSAHAALATAISIDGQDTVSTRVQSDINDTTELDLNKTAQPHKKRRRQRSRKQHSTATSAAHLATADPHVEVSVSEPARQYSDVSNTPVQQEKSNLQHEPQLESVGSKRKRRPSQRQRHGISQSPE